MKRKCWITAFVLFFLGLCVVLLSPADSSFLVTGAVGGICLFGALAVVCAKEKHIDRTGDPLIEGTSPHVSTSYHRAIYEEKDNPGAIAMIEKGEEMVLEGERRIKGGDYEGGLALVQEGEKRINRGHRFLGKKGGETYEGFFGKGLDRG